MLFLFSKSNMTNKVSDLLFSDLEETIEFKDIPKSFPQVGILTNRVIQRIPKESFVWLEKTDGVRTILLIEKNHVYNVTKTPYLLFNIKGSQFVKRTILDTECYNDKYYTFDVIQCNGEDVSNKFFLDRMKSIDSLFSDSTDSKIVLKTYESISNWESLIDFTNKHVSPNTNNVIDGVICQRTDMPYFTKISNPGCFKLKRKVLNTIDFKLKLHKKNNEDIFFLYLTGKKYNYFYNFRLISRRNPFMKQDSGYDRSDLIPNKEPLLVLFSSPYQNGLHIYDPSKEWNTEGYFEENITEIKRLTRQIKANPSKFDNAVVEMSLAGDTWVPMRVRTDKQYPNGYEVGITNCGIMFSPLNPKDNYFIDSHSTSSHIPEEVIDAYHKVNSTMRKFILEHSLNKGNKLTVIDLAGGRGADELELFHCGAYNIIAIDADREALTQYVNRTHNTILKTQWEPLMKDFKDNAPKSGILLNVICDVLGKNNDKLIKDVFSRGEFKESKGADLILMNYAIHYLCYDHECLRALGKFVNETLKDDGVFIFSSFNGDKIKKDCSNGALVLSDVFTIKLIDPMVESSKDAQWAKMPLPTIDKTGYREEPLVFKSWIENDLGLEIIEHYNLVDECKEYIKGIENVDLVIDYLKYIQIYVMKKGK